MRFTVIGHGALYVESGGATLIADPWLFGSCYWRSWWHYPPVGQVKDSWLNPDYIYVTHHHFDHFHYPSLRRINKSAKVFVPSFAVDFMAGELKDLGFRNVIELTHGDSYELNPDLKITSYQYGFDDSTLIVEDASGVVLANLNDCKVRGRSLKQITDKHGKPHFLLKNYSWAQSYPHCYTAADPKDLTLLTREHYIADFLLTVREANPKFAVPFASTVCFLHPETTKFNANAITPRDIEVAFNEADFDGTSFVAMGPGDTWDTDHGFALRDGSDFFDHRLEYIASLEQQVSDQVAESLEREAALALTFDAFSRHFSRFVHALPPGAALILKRPVVFRVDGRTEPFWVIDFKRKRVYQASTLPDNYASLIQTPEGLLADAIDKNIVNFIYISMRLRVDLSPGGVNVDLMFWAFLSIWELGYLPLRRSLHRRAFRAAWKRRRELTDGVAGKLIGRGPLVARMASTLMTDKTTASKDSGPS